MIPSEIKRVASKCMWRLTFCQLSTPFTLSMLGNNFNRRHFEIFSVIFFFFFFLKKKKQKNKKALHFMQIVSYGMSKLRQFA